MEIPQLVAFGVLKHQLEVYTVETHTTIVELHIQSFMSVYFKYYVSIEHLTVHVLRLYPPTGHSISTPQVRRQKLTVGYNKTTVDGASAVAKAW